ncbi:SIMPL domain-containing protein [Microbulbifer thermotolerans]|uniref:SIMPL domain-containing protein n=1 Tax=Microbulbifer thermotolerans TaxID=252514 RepID=A0AB35HWC0_MICTH|nr:SIMPL domain-containing protein [Microbulbifer thermotolerans]MCX2780040.1 SIMPL domain-containing protein [Microbulbifer thermotolerans]MCX2801867.1 SIMPL domain-containing protein [Microbulbifer thermotolerans]MCX2805463.1 SIMPL domain-containing protein [Microbulbifer thermotolerans]
MKVVKLSTIALFTLLATACGGDRSPAERGTLISISATGEASQAPDVANISAGVVTESEDSEQAMRDNATQMDKLIKAIKKAGIDEKDVQTSGISLSPRYDYQQGRKPQITGYQARNTVSIKVRDLPALGEVLDTLAAAGANQIHGPSLEIGEPEPVLAEARKRALDIARARAETYAKALDMRVRRIVSISEQGGRIPQPMPMMRAEIATAKDSAATPVAPGETTLSVNLDLVFELR